MIIDPKSISPGEMYRHMIGVIVPRPIAFVSTVSAEGGFNVAPFSYFMPISSRPPLIGISMNQRAGGPKDTLMNMRHTGDFVVNIVTEPLLERMVYTSGDWPGDVSEFELTGLTPASSERVQAPGVAESPVRLECGLYREIELGETTLVLGEIMRVDIRDDVVTDGRVDPLKLRAVGRLGGDAYTVVRDVIHQPRPRVDSTRR